MMRSDYINNNVEAKVVYLPSGGQGAPGYEQDDFLHIKAPRGSIPPSAPLTIRQSAFHRGEVYVFTLAQWGVA